jgi:hypothetical protein
MGELIVPGEGQFDGDSETLRSAAKETQISFISSGAPNFPLDSSESSLTLIAITLIDPTTEQMDV